MIRPRWTAVSGLVLAFIVMLLVGQGVARADIANRGGIITSVTAHGGSGQFQVVVANPFNVAVTGYVNYTLWNASGQQVGYATTTYSIAPNQQFSFGTNYGPNFATSTAGAQCSDSTGANTATGYANSQLCDTCSDSGSGAGSHGPVATKPDY